MRISTIAAALCVLGLYSANATAEDPCLGYDVACDSDGCTACWDTGPNSVECDEYSREEIKLTLPGCIDSSWTPGLSALPGSTQPAFAGHGQGLQPLTSIPGQGQTKKLQRRGRP